MRRYPEDFDADPDPTEAETDPDHWDQVFDQFRDEGLRPEDLRSKATAERYAEWLTRQPVNA